MRERNLYKLMKELNQCKKHREDLKNKNDNFTQKLLWQISEKEADIKNNIDIINEIESDKKWYPMLIHDPITKRYQATIHQFKPDDYKVYREKVNQEITKHNLQRKMKEDVINHKIFAETNDKMMRCLVKESEGIKQNVGKLGTQYHGGSWSANKDIWKFKNGEQRLKYGESLCDILRWYNTHENREYNDS